MTKLSTLFATAAFALTAAFAPTTAFASCGCVDAETWTASDYVSAYSETIQMVEFRAGEDIEIYLEGWTSEGEAIDVDIKVFSPSGQFLLLADDYGSDLVDFMASERGYYMVQVVNADGYGGEFELTFTAY